jgi:photosystem II stability/assembly factor-like uncharacterized protein
MKLPHLISALAAFALLFARHAGAQGTLVHPQPAPAGASTVPQPTPEQIVKMPVKALPIEDFKRLNSTAGWVSTGSQLLLTTDNGTHWKDISPPVPAPSNPNENRFGDVFFLDTLTGWAISGGDLQEGGPDSDETETVLSLTVDGGATWTAAILPRLKPLQKVGGVNFTFADRLHGWLMIQHQSGPAFSFSSLYSTSDGGRTWQEAKGNPGFYGDIRAFPNGDIWVSGDYPEHDVPTVSRDGGNSFQEISLDAPKEIAPADDPSYNLPVFEDNLRGYEAVTYSGGIGKKSAAVLFATADGGKTWKVDRILSNLAEISAGQKATSAIVGSTWIAPFAPKGSQPTLMKLRPNDRITAPDHKSSSDFRSCGLSFFTPDEGWANCSGDLSSTTDGGASWTSITPRHRNGVLTTDPLTPNKTMQNQTKTIHLPGMAKSRSNSVAPLVAPSNKIAYVSGVDQHLGFDRNLILSTGDMGGWPRSLTTMRVPPVLRFWGPGRVASLFPSRQTPRTSTPKNHPES